MVKTLRAADSSENSGQNNSKTPISVKKKYALLISILFGLVFIESGLCRAMEFIDYHGISGFYGQSDWTNIGPDAVDDYKWSNINYFIGKDLKPWLSLETSLGPGYIETDNYNETGTLEWRVLLDLHHKFLYLKMGGGVAYLFDSGNMPDLSGANFYAIASFSVGLRYNFDENKKTGPEVLLGYTIEHLSDPFEGADNGDSGLNAGAIQALISWDF